jgi:hypothetical protein
MATKKNTKKKSTAAKKSNVRKPKQARKQPPKKKTSSGKTVARKSTARKTITKKKAPPKAKRSAPKKPVARKKAAAKVKAGKPKAKTGNAEAAKKIAKAPAAKAPKKAVKAANRPRRDRDIPLDSLDLSPQVSGLESGDLEGLSNTESADSESVDELLEEGNAFEAGVVWGIEDSRNREGQEVRTREVPEDDVPQEYLDPD